MKNHGSFKIGRSICYKWNISSSIIWHVTFVYGETMSPIFCLLFLGGVDICVTNMIQNTPESFTHMHSSCNQVKRRIQFNRGIINLLLSALILHIPLREILAPEKRGELKERRCWMGFIDAEDENTPGESPQTSWASAARDAFGFELFLCS